MNINSTDIRSLFSHVLLIVVCSPLKLQRYKQLVHNLVIIVCTLFSPEY